MHDCVQWPSKGTYHDYPPITCDDRDSICSAAHMKRQPPAARGGGGGGGACIAEGTQMLPRRGQRLTIHEVGQAFYTTHAFEKSL